MKLIKNILIRRKQKTNMIEWYLFTYNRLSKSKASIHWEISIIWIKVIKIKKLKSNSNLKTRSKSKSKTGNLSDKKGIETDSLKNEISSQKKQIIVSNSSRIDEKEMCRICSDPPIFSFLNKVKKISGEKIKSDKQIINPNFMDVLKMTLFSCFSQNICTFCFTKENREYYKLIKEEFMEKVEIENKFKKYHEDEILKELFENQEAFLARN